MAHYLISEKKIDDNCKSVFSAFSGINLTPSYSVKTNHVPHIVNRFHDNGFLVEVVSDMEVEIAKFAHVPLSDVVYNGPKKGELAHEVASEGGIIVFDSMYDFESFCQPCRCMFRVAVDIANGIDTRFGTNPRDIPGLVRDAVIYGYDVVGIHCHATRGRDLGRWSMRLCSMASVYNAVKDMLSDRIVDLGGNMASALPKELADRFPGSPSYEQYACVFAEHESLFPEASFMLEMGTSVVSDCVSYEANVIDVKRTDNNTYVLLDTCNFNLGWASKDMNHPVRVLSLHGSEHVHNAKFVGLLCTENDVFHRGFTGFIGRGSKVEFSHVGSYAIGLKPPFITMDDPIVYVHSDGTKETVKRRETASDILSTFKEIDFK